MKEKQMILFARALSICNNLSEKDQEVLTAVAGLNWLDKKFNVTDNLKKGVNSLIKGMRGWFK